MALITVMVILLLGIIAVLAAARSGLLNEALVGNDTDYSRTLAAAEALLRDAEIDVRGRLPNGFYCASNPLNTGSEDVQPNFVGCRNAVGGNPWFPNDEIEYQLVANAVAVSPAATPCLQGICVPASLTTLHNPPAFTIENNLPAMAPFGVRYGTFTRTGAPALAGSLATNPILRPPFPVAVDAPNQGWYWVEVFVYKANAMGPRSIGVPPSGGSPFIYRITAVALGQKPGTRAVLKSFFVPNPAT
ncbi:hypothetical protein [Rhodoferax sp.]|uniref:pilus assembly PilX family protein n=1 Tax=Rhodoferax sp. TaxID=50421 RepID=UPI002745B5B8|nr:hypothetical protein [Rhodoferax sp.]